MIDIENNNFEDAYVKANSLYYTADYSSEIEDKWDNTRKAILKQIEAAEKESKGEEKKSFWNIFDQILNIVCVVFFESVYQEEILAE